MGRNKNSSKKNTFMKIPPAERSEINQLVETLLAKCSQISEQTLLPSAKCREFEDIFNIVEEIRQREKSIQLPIFDRRVYMQDLMKWATNNNIKYEKLHPAEYTDMGWGLRSCQSLSQSEIVLEVPVEAILTENCYRNTYLASLAEQDKLLQNMGNVRLALVLLIELLRPDSKWRAYVRSLPRDCYTPLYCSPSQVRRLQHSPVLDPVVKLYRNISRQYGYIYKLLRSVPQARYWPLTQHFTFDAYRWAVSCVATRVNKLPVTGGEQLALVPIWDLVNHQPGKIFTDFEHADQKLVCYAGRDYAAEEQFTMHYGDRSNADLFLHSGFVLKNNPHSSLPLCLGISKGDTLYKEKMGVLRALQLDASGRSGLPKLSEDSNEWRGGPCAVLPMEINPVSPQLWAFAVVFCASQELVNELVSSRRPHEVIQAVISDSAHQQVKYSACCFLRTRLTLLQGSYENALVADIPVIGESGLSAPPEQTPGQQRIDALISELLNYELGLIRAAALHLTAAEP